MNNYLKVVVAGDVDSGKSTLIGRYLYETGSLSHGVMDDIAQVCKNLGRDFEFAYLLDSFEEERHGQLTLDTAQSFCRGKNNKTIVFIDVPGHKELLKNMLSGASYADIAVLVIDVTKSIREQTRRHALVLKFLGIPKIIAVVNKMDEAGYNKGIFLGTKRKIAVIFKELGMKIHGCVPVSAKNGENLLRKSGQMRWYEKRTVASALNNVKTKKPAGNFLFLTQDIFQSEEESFAIGPVISGTIKTRGRVSVLPLRRKSTVNRIKYFDKDIRSVSGVKAVGLILKDMQGVQRGQILSAGKNPIVTNLIRARIIYLRSVNFGLPLELRCSVQQVKVRIKKNVHVWDTASFFVKKTLPRKHDLAEVVLEADREIAVEKYIGNNSLGRFAIFDKRKKIVAVGIII